MPYLIEANRSYVYESNIEVGAFNSDNRTLTRSDFDIPFTAEIEKFKIKNIWLSVIPESDNFCNEAKLNYTIRVDDNYLNYENTFSISTEPINEFLINDEFSLNLQNLRQLIEQSIISNKTVNLEYKLQCEEAQKTHIVMVIRFTMDLKYTNCEEVFSGSDLEDCIF